MQVLIVDDDPDGVEALRFLLEKRGHPVQVAHNGLEALDHVAAGGRPHVVLLDLLMPVMDGWEFLARRKEDERMSDTPVLVMTGSDFGPDAKSETVLRKPVDVDMLMWHIDA